MFPKTYFKYFPIAIADRERIDHDQSTFTEQLQNLMKVEVIEHMLHDKSRQDLSTEVFDVHNSHLCKT